MARWDESRWPSRWGAGQDPVRLPSLDAAAVAADEEWRHAAACAGEEPDLFFPVGSTGPALAQIKAAKQVCARCPVRAECLAFALDTRQVFGVWGGLSEDERDQLRRRPS